MSFIKPFFGAVIQLVTSTLSCEVKQQKPDAFASGLLFCAQGRIRTFVAHWATDLQSVAIDHSATCALLQLRTHT